MRHVFDHCATYNGQGVGSQSKELSSILSPFSLSEGQWFPPRASRIRTGYCNTLDNWDMFLTTVLLMMAMELARRAKRYHRSHLSQCQWFPPRASRIWTLYLMITCRVFYHCASAADQENKNFFSKSINLNYADQKMPNTKNNKKRHLKPKEILPSF